MWDVVKISGNQEEKTYVWFLPLHKILIENFSSFKKELIKVLLWEWKIWNTIKEVNQSINEILNFDPKNDVPWNAVKYAWKISHIIRVIARDNTLFHNDLPKWWDEYLDSALEETLCSMKNKIFLRSIFKNAIDDIKAGKKVNFSEIYKLNPEKATYKYELAKALDILHQKYNIEFISVWWSGNILKIWEFVKKNDVKDNIWKIEKAFKRLQDFNGVTLNIVNQNFLDFIKEVVQNRNLNEFQQHEFVIYCLKKNPEFEIWLVRTFIKKIFTTLMEQWIIIRKKSKINFEVRFNKVINDFYIMKFFPNLDENKEVKQGFYETLDKIQTKTAKKNKEYVDILKDEILELHSRWEFFVLARFIEKYWLDETRILYYNRVLLKLIKIWILWRKWRERYYINNTQFKVVHDKIDILKTSHAILKYEIHWNLNVLSNKIIYYIFQSFKEIGLFIEDIKSDDLKINIENGEIFFIFLNEKFIKFDNHIMHICDEIWEKKWITIHSIFNKDVIYL